MADAAVAPLPGPNEFFEKSNIPATSTSAGPPAPAPGPAPAAAPKWMDIVNDPDFKKLPGETKEKLRSDFFDHVIKPQLSEGQLKAAKDRFDSKTKATTTESFTGYLYQQAKKGLASLPKLPTDIVGGLATAKDRGTDTSYGDQYVLDPNTQRMVKKVGSGAKLTADAEAKRDKKDTSLLSDIKHESGEQGFVNRHVNEFFGIDNDKAAPSTGAKLVGGAAEFIGAGGPMAIREVAIRPGVIKKVAQAAREVISSSAAGMTSEEAAELTRGKGPLAEFAARTIGAVAGGGALEMAVPTVAERSALRATGELKSTLGSEVEAFRKTEAGKQLSAVMESDPATIRNIEQARQVEKGVLGFKADFPTLLGTPSAGALAEKVSKDSAEAGASMRRFRQTNEQALEDFRNDNFAHAGRNVREIVESDLKQKTEELDLLHSDVEEKIANLTKQISDRGFSQAQGERLLQLRAAGETIRQGEKNAYYTDVYNTADLKGFKADGAGIVAEVNRLKKQDNTLFQKAPATWDFINSKLKNLAGTEEAGAAMVKEADRLRAKGGNANETRAKLLELKARQMKADTPDEIPMSFEALHSLKKRLGQDIRNADPQTGYMLKGIRDKVEEQLQKDPELNAQLKKADAFWQTEYNQVFRQGGGGRAADETRFGRATLESEIVSKNFMKYGEKGAQDWKKVFEHNPEESAQLLEAGVLDELASKLHGQPLTPKKLQTFMADNKAFIDQFPQLKGQLVESQKVIENLANRADQLAKMRSNLQTSQLKSLFKTDDIVPFIGKNVNDLGFMGHMASLAKKDPEAASALTKAFADYTAKIPPEKISGWLTAHSGTLKPIFDAAGPNHWGNIMMLANGEKILARAAKAAPLPYEVDMDPISRSFGTSSGAMLNRMYSVAQKRAGQFWNVATLASRAFFKSKSGNQESVMAQVMSNPEMADQLVKTQYGPLLSHSKKSVEDLTADIKDAPTKTAMRAAITALKKAKDVAANLQDYPSWRNHAIRTTAVVSAEENRQVVR